MQPQFVNIGEKTQRSAPEGRDITRHLLSPPVGCADSPLSEGAVQRFALLGRTESSAPTSRHSEPVRRLAWESVLPKRETDCRVAARREASALGVLLAMTGCVGAASPAAKKSKPRRGLLPLFRTACPAPLPVRRWHHPGSRAGDARRGCSAPAGWRWPGHSPLPPM